MIRKGIFKDIDVLMEITKACANRMIANGIFQWNEHYPNKNAFIEDYERGELYVLEIEDKIIGSVVLSTFMDREYIPIEWLTKNKNNLYIHRLAIHPAFQGKGYAQRLMEFAEDFAREQRFDSIRLDTFSKNEKNQKFYKQRGYKQLGSIYFPKQSEHPFYCYELLL